MGLLEYTNFTVDDVVKKSIPSFYAKDPVLDALRTKNKVIRSGGTQVRVPRIKSGHSDISEISLSNIEIPLAKKDTFSYMTGDWARYVKPIILPHLDRDRMQSNADKKRWVNDTTQAVLQSFRNNVSRQIYVGDVAALRGLGTLNGWKTGLSTSGFENGALQFVVPGSQSGTYMNETRNVDTTNDEDNWYNQMAEHNGFAGGTYLSVAEELKITADSYAEDDEGISMGICSIANHVQLGEAIRKYASSSDASIVYRPEDIENGRAHKTVHIAGGIKYFSNRFMTDARIVATGSGANDGQFVYLLNPNGMQLWVNANNEFRVTKFTDHTLHGNMDADVGYVFLEIQFAVPNLVIQACTMDTSV